MTLTFKIKVEWGISHQTNAQCWCCLELSDSCGDRNKSSLRKCFTHFVTEI